MSRASVLLRLQQIDDRIAALQSELASVEASLRGDPELERLRAVESVAQGQHRETAAVARLAELEAASLQARIRDLDRRLYGGTIRNPAELMEMQRELDSMRVRLSTAEDDALERMEEVDSALATMQAASANVVAREAQRAGAMEPLRTRLASLVAQLETSNEERDALRAEAEPADLSLYARIASRRRPAVTQLAGECCGGRPPPGVDQGQVRG